MLKRLVPYVKNTAFQGSYRVRPMGRPAEGLRRQGLASCADIPCLTPPHLSHYVFVPFWHLTTFLVTYIHSLSPLWPRNARRRDNGRTRFGNRAAPRLSRRAGRPKPRHAKNGARPALCGRDEVREGHLSSFIVLKEEEEKNLSAPQFSAGAARVPVRFGHGQRFRARARPVATTP